MIKVCMHCNKNLTFTSYEYYKISRAVKPKNTPYRWKHIGYACSDKCYDAITKGREDLR